MREAVSIAVALAMVAGNARAATCDRPEHTVAVRTAALQQEMMVAAFMCRDIAAYNDFVLTHQTALQEADHALLAFFQQAGADAGFAGYNTYKTELANSSSLRSLHDPWFCARVNADFRAAVGRPLEQLLTQVPYPVDTGSIQCGYWAPAVQVGPQAFPERPRPHRTWLGRLIDAIFH